MSWHMNGTYFEACNCDAACPCIFLSAPTEGECTVLVAWHIDRGQDGEVSLDGLNAAMAVHAPGHMLQTKWRAALYLDERASDPQEQSLTKIFGGQAGGQPAVLAQFVDDILGVSSVAIDYRAMGKERSLTIPNVALIEIEALAGQNDGEVTVSGRMSVNADPLPPSGLWLSGRIDEIYTLMDSRDIRTPDYDSTLFSYSRP